MPIIAPEQAPHDTTTFRELKEMARSEFPLLSPDDQRFFNHLLYAVSHGLFFVVGTGDKDVSTLPHNAYVVRSGRRTIPAAWVRWLCSDRSVSSRMTPSGLTIVNAEITGDLDLTGATILFPIFVQGANFLGTIKLSGAKTRSLYFPGSYFAQGIEMNGATVEGSIQLRGGFRSSGRVNFDRSRISGDVDCESATIDDVKGRALTCDLTQIGGSVFLRNGFSAHGVVDFHGAEIFGDLDFARSSFTASHLAGDSLMAFAIRADGARIRCSVNLVSAKCRGAINFIGAKIGRNFECDGADFINPEAIAFDGQAIEVGGMLFFRERFFAEGRVSLVSAKIGQVLVWQNISHPQRATLDLMYAKAFALQDDAQSWPELGKLRITGFAYEEIVADSPRDVERRLSWIRRQKYDANDEFYFQPYEQFAQVLSQTGRESDAITVQIEKHRDRTKRLPWHKRIWPSIEDFTIRYGYRPWRALGISVAFITLGAVLFWCGQVVGTVIPTNSQAYRIRGDPKSGLVDEYQRFNPVAYSVEAFVPFLKLGQTNNWSPNAGLGPNLHEQLPFSTGSALRTYLWAHIVCGWFLTSLWVAAVSGIIKK